MCGVGAHLYCFTVFYSIKYCFYQSSLLLPYCDKLLAIFEMPFAYLGCASGLHWQKFNKSMHYHFLFWCVLTGSHESGALPFSIDVWSCDGFRSWRLWRSAMGRQIRTFPQNTRSQSTTDKRHFSTCHSRYVPHFQSFFRDFFGDSVEWLTGILS